MKTWIIVALGCGNYSREETIRGNTVPTKVWMSTKKRENWKKKSNEALIGRSSLQKLDITSLEEFKSSFVFNNLGFSARNIMPLPYPSAWAKHFLITVNLLVILHTKKQDFTIIKLPCSILSKVKKKYFKICAFYKDILFQKRELVQ